MVVGVEDPVVGDVPPLEGRERERGKSQKVRREGERGKGAYPIIEVTDGS